MNRRISTRAQRVDYDEQDFHELVEFFLTRERSLDFFTQRLSTNPDERIWIPNSNGRTAPANREYFEGAPRIISITAEIYRNDFRGEGGRFWIDWLGAYSIRDQEYFVRWNKSAKLTLYVSLLRKDLTFLGVRDAVLHRLTSPWANAD
jgi:hypothetical protein